MARKMGGARKEELRSKEHNEQPIKAREVALFLLLMGGSIYACLWFLLVEALISK